MNSPILISVVIAVLNNRDGLVAAIDSIGSHPELVEIIVIDGGSTDGTVEQITRRANGIAYWETGMDQGIADAFNRGIARARGHLVAILNSDDSWTPEVVPNLLAALKRSPATDVFYGAIRYFDRNTSYTYVRSPRLSSMKYRMWLFHPAIFVKRSCYNAVGLYDPRFTHAMDSEWCHRAISAGCRFTEVPCVLANMSLGGVSDREYLVSLRQYRDSLVKNGLCGPAPAFLYFLFFVLVKTIMRSPFLKGAKRMRDRLPFRD